MKARRQRSLSRAQRRIWFLDRFDPDHVVFNVANAVRIRGPFDVERARAALADVVARHEPLRLSFRELDGEPVGVVLDEVSVGLPCEDVAGLEAARERARELARAPFELGVGPPFRFHVLRVAAAEHVLVLVIHHIVTDRWSLSVLLDEFVRIYATTGDEHAALEPLPCSFAEWIDRARLAASPLRTRELLDYWKHALGERPPTLDLPLDRTRPPLLTFRGRRLSLQLSPELVTAVRAFARALRCTPTMVYLAAFVALLRRYARQDELLIATFLAGRTDVASESLVGLFVNTLVLRAQLADDPSFPALVKAMRKRFLEAHAHQELPFEELLEALELDRDVSRPPLVQVAFNHQNTKLPSGDAAGWKLEVEDVDPSVARFELSLTVRDAPGGGLETCFEFNTELFQDDTIRRMGEQYGLLLAGALAGGPSCERPAASLPLLDAAERERLLVAWNDTSLDVPATTLSAAFFAQAARTPERIAVVCAGTELTYAALTRRIVRLARVLRDHGAGPGQLVGLHVERSADLVTAVLATLATGAAYVPLDPAFPAERLAFVLEDARAALLVTEHGSADGLAFDGPRVDLAQALAGEDARADDSKNASDSPQNRSADPRSLAYVLYTSGSTGRPKGVAIEHDAVLNLLAGIDRELRVHADDTLLAITTLSFDIAALELFLPLLRGARVVVATSEEATDPVRLAARLDEVGATVFQATPVTWQLLLESGWNGRRDLRALCGGEAMPRDVAQRLLERTGALWNVYGPTETTVWSTCHRIERVDREIPIGRPLANQRVYVLDERGEPVPPGVPGELWIAGRGLARSYLRRPELDLERFHPDPFGPGGRMYRTGDLARWRAEGVLEHLGRADQQVKVRGFRIEPGEIETLLRRAPGVEAAVVVARALADDTRLVAYIAHGEQTPPDVATLRSALASTLPDYMVPSAFVLLERLPETPNGKVDRRALPAPELARDGVGARYAPPENDLELGLVAIWERLLDVHPVGIQDDFFLLGGHSLLAIRLVGEVETAFGKRLPLTELFRAPTVAGVAAALTRIDGASSTPGVVALRAEGDAVPLFLLRGIFLYRDLAERLAAGRAVYGVHVQAELEALAEGGSAATIDELVEAYRLEIQRLRPTGPYLLGGVSFGGVLAFELARALRARGEEVALVAVLDTLLPGAERRRLLSWLRHQLALAASRGPRDVLDRWRARRGAQGLLGPELRNDDGATTDLRRARARLVQAATRGYVPAPYDGALALFRATDRTRTPGWEVTPELGWRGVARGPFAIHDVPGDHLGMLREPDVALLAERLQAELVRASAQTNSRRRIP